MKRYFFVFLMTLFTFSLLMQNAAAAEIVTAHAIEDCNKDFVISSPNLM